jgi:glycosyltransferase involved in cell wall biosynthesis
VQWQQFLWTGYSTQSQTFQFDMKRFIPMRLSVVIPAHNGELYLAEAIRSALEQTRPADEILLVDDESRDRTSEIAHSLEWAGKVIYRFNSPATGYVDAWNRAIAMASGDYVAILHQDDLLHPEFLARMAAALDRYPNVGHLYSACNYIDADGNANGAPPEPYSGEPILYSGREYAQRYLSGVAANRHIHRCPGVLTRRALLMNECRYRKEAGHIADDDFFLRVGAFTDVVGIAEPLASYRNHPQSATGKLDNMSLRLARDYVFQAGYHRGAESLLDSAGLASIDRLATRFINLLLFQSLSTGRDDWTHEALRFSEAYRARAPGVFTSYLPLCARPMWRLAESGMTRAPAKFYTRLLGLGNALRKLLKGVSE